MYLGHQNVINIINTYINIDLYVLYELTRL